REEIRRRVKRKIQGCSVGGTRVESALASEPVQQQECQQEAEVRHHNRRHLQFAGDGCRDVYQERIEGKECPTVLLRRVEWSLLVSIRRNYEIPARIPDVDDALEMGDRIGWPVKDDVRLVEPRLRIGRRYDDGAGEDEYADHNRAGQR